MTTHVDLPSGGWVELRDPSTIRIKDVEAYQKAVADVDGSVFGAALRRAQMVMVVDSWSFDMAIPGVDPESVGELVPADAYAIQRWFVAEVDGLLWPKAAGDDASDPKAGSDN